MHSDHAQDALRRVYNTNTHVYNTQTHTNMYRIHRDCETKTKRREGGRGGVFKTQEIKRSKEI